MIINAKYTAKINKNNKNKIKKNKQTNIVFNISKNRKHKTTPPPIGIIIETNMIFLLKK